MYQSPSEITRDILKNIFPQKENFEESRIPINTNISIPYYEIDKSRVLIYDANTLSPEYCLGNKEVLRTQGLTIVVSDKDAKIAYDRSQLIFNYLNCIKQTEEVLGYRAVSDIEALGINTKKYYLYKCDYIIMR